MTFLASTGLSSHEERKNYPPPIEAVPRGSPSVLPRPAAPQCRFFLHKRPELVDFDLAEVQIVGQHLRQGRGLSRCPAHATR